MDWQAVEADADRSWQRLGFRVPSFLPARSLSGGNLQRMVIARELLHDPRLIIASYLTRGLDVQSTQAAREALLQARDQGAGVLLDLRGPGGAVRVQRPAGGHVRGAHRRSSS